MKCVLNMFTLLASIWLLLHCKYLPVSASYTKYVRVGDFLQLECISDFDDQSWTVMWLKATTYWRRSGKLLSKNNMLDEQNTDNRFKIEVHQITTTRKRFSFTIVNVERVDDAVYWCVALPQNNNSVDIAVINKQGADLTGDIYITVEFPPGPGDPICLNKTMANKPVTLLCCHGFATPFPTRKWLLNGVKLNNTKWTRNGKLYCLAVDISAGEETYKCELSSAAFPDYKSTCEYNLLTPGQSVSNKFLPGSVTEANCRNVSDKPRVPKPSTLPKQTKIHDLCPVWIALVVIGSVIGILVCIMISVYLCSRRCNKHDSFSPKHGFSTGHKLQTENYYDKALEAHH